MGRLILSLTLMLLVFRADAQLARGATAPDFTVQDINGGSYSLYAKMGSKGACVAFEATWCGACWQFHEDGILQNIFTNLSADATAIFLESDFSTNTACLYGNTGCNLITKGDWVAGSPYQICDLSPTNGANVVSNYAQTYWPTIYVISPDKRAWEIHVLVYSEFENWLTKSFKLATTATAINCTCGNNGKILLNISGGYGTRAYNWSNGSNAKDLENVGGGFYSVTITDQNGYFKSFGPWSITDPPLQVDITSSSLTQVKCYNEANGSIEIQAAYGTPPYSYYWSNSRSTKNIDNLKAGNYTVTVTDNAGCTRSKSYSIIQPTILNLTATATKEDCDQSNATINARALGGVPSYHFDIGSGSQQKSLFTDLKGGKDYFLTLTDDNACSATIKVTVEVTHKPKASAGVTKSFVDCINESLSLDGSKSSQGSNFNYLWTTNDGTILHGAETLHPDISIAGKYTLKVTDTNNKCTDTESVQINDQRFYPNIKTIGDTTLNCKLTEITLKGNSDSLPVIFYWKKANDSLFYQYGKTLITSDSGSYFFYVKDSLNACIAKDTVYVKKDQSIPIAIAKVDKDISCKNVEIQIDGSASSQGPNFVYQWNTANGNITSGANTLTPMVDHGGNYSLLISNTNNYCEQTTAVVVRQQTNIISDFSQAITDLSVLFNDQSIGVPTSWQWNFGEISSSENTSTEKNPTHLYATIGEYIICLDVENDCNKTSKCNTILVGIQSNLQIVQSTVMDVHCFGGIDGAIVLELQGGIPPYTFNWSNQQITKDLINLSAGIYTVEITDQQGSKIIKSFEVKQPDDLIVTHADIINVQAAQHNGSIFLNISGGNDPFVYLWNNGQTTNPIENLSSGDYMCTISDGNLCIKSFGPYTINELTSTNDANNNSDFENDILQFSVLPNPVNGKGFIDLKLTSIQKYKLEFLTIFGASIWNTNYQNNGMSIPIDVNNFAKGVYFVILKTERAQRIVKWVVE